MSDKLDPLKKHTFGPNRTLDDSAGAKGEDRKRAVDANRTGGGSVPRPRTSLTAAGTAGTTSPIGSTSSPDREMSNTPS